MTQLSIIEMTIDNWQGACRLVNDLLRAGAEARWASENFRVVKADGVARELAAGTFLITAMEVSAEFTLELAQRRYGAEAEPIQSVDGFVGQLLHAPRIALYGGGGAPLQPRPHLRRARL